MQNFQNIILISIRKYTEIFKSAPLNRDRSNLEDTWLPEFEGFVCYCFYFSVKNLLQQYTVFHFQAESSSKDELWWSIEKAVEKNSQVYCDLYCQRLLEA